MCVLEFVLRYEIQQVHLDDHFDCQTDASVCHTFTC